jgi:hypothetical protein
VPAIRPVAVLRSGSGFVIGSSSAGGLLHGVEFAIAVRALAATSGPSHAAVVWRAAAQLASVGWWLL